MAESQVLGVVRCCKEVNPSLKPADCTSFIIIIIIF